MNIAELKSVFVLTDERGELYERRGRFNPAVWSASSGPSAAKGARCASRFTETIELPVLTVEQAKLIIEADNLIYSEFGERHTEQAEWVKLVRAAETISGIKSNITLETE
jgi:hypothetical protein